MIEASLKSCFDLEVSPTQRTAQTHILDDSACTIALLLARSHKLRRYSPSMITFAKTTQAFRIPGISRTIHSKEIEALIQEANEQIQKRPLTRTLVHQEIRYVGVCHDARVNLHQR